MPGFYFEGYKTYFFLYVFLIFLLRMQTNTFSHSLLGMVSLPWVSLTTALTLGLDWEQKTTGMLKTGGTGKMHQGNGIVPGNREVVMVQDDKQGDMREFPL